MSKTMQAYDPAIPGELWELLELAGRNIATRRPKFKGASGAVADWHESETHVKQQMEFKAKCFKCACLARLRMVLDAGVYMELERCRAPARCSMSAPELIEYRIDLK